MEERKITPRGKKDMRQGAQGNGEGREGGAVEERRKKNKEKRGSRDGRREAKKRKMEKEERSKKNKPKVFLVCVCVCVCFKGMKRYWRWELRDYIKRAQKSRKEKTPGKIEEQAGSTREREVKQK